MIKADIWLLHLYVLELQLYTNVLRSGFISNLLEMSNHNNMKPRGEDANLFFSLKNA